MGHCIIPCFFCLVNDLVSGNCPSNSELQWCLHFIVYLIMLLFTIILLTFLFVYCIIKLWLLQQDIVNHLKRKLRKAMLIKGSRHPLWTSTRRDLSRPTTGRASNEERWPNQGSHCGHRREGQSDPYAISTARQSRSADIRVQTDSKGVVRQTGTVRKQIWNSLSYLGIDSISYKHLIL